MDPERAFSELGFDSLAAVELRNRLEVATRLRVAPTAGFDYPSCAALARHLLAEADPEGGSLEAELDDLARRLGLLADDGARRVEAAARLRALAAALEEEPGTPTVGVEPAELEEASDEELLEFIDAQIGPDPLGEARSESNGDTRG